MRENSRGGFAGAAGACHGQQLGCVVLLRGCRDGRDGGVGRGVGFDRTISYTHCDMGTHFTPASRQDLAAKITG
eukprot:2774288-Amphidinium_carterae.1